MPRFKIESSETVLRTPVFSVDREMARGPEGLLLEKHLIRHPGAAVILPIDEEGRVLLIRQYRLAVRKHLWELPAGTVDPGESPLQTAKRELAEETGYRARRWRKIVSYLTTPGMCDERMTAYAAKELTAGQASPEPYELIEKHWFAREEAEQMAQRGVIEDAKSLLTLLCARRIGV